MTTPFVAALGWYLVGLFYHAAGEWRHKTYATLILFPALSVEVLGIEIGKFAIHCAPPDCQPNLDNVNGITNALLWGALMVFARNRLAVPQKSNSKAFEVAKPIERIYITIRGHEIFEREISDEWYKRIMVVAFTFFGASLLVLSAMDLWPALDKLYVGFIGFFRPVF